MRFKVGEYYRCIDRNIKFIYGKAMIGHRDSLIVGKAYRCDEAMYSPAQAKKKEIANIKLSGEWTFVFFAYEGFEDMFERIDKIDGKIEVDSYEAMRELEK